jgi:hypothetical protein
MDDEQRQARRDALARSRARKRGEVIPYQKRGPKPGYVQTPEHVEKRTRRGPEHPAWMGDDASEGAKRARERRRQEDETMAAESV